MNNSDKPKPLEIQKCIACAFAVWPQHAPGFCSVHNMGTTEAREPSGPCGSNAINFRALSADYKGASV